MKHNKFKIIFENLSREEIDTISYIQGLACELSMKCQPIQNREMSLAMTNLEQAMMWAIKAICVQSETNKQRGAY